MKKLYLMLLAAVVLPVMNGCVSSSPEYFEELTTAEQTQLLNSAKVLALQGKAVPEHLQGVFMELVPYQRIVYDGNKHGKATFRWEIYDSLQGKGKKVTQKDVNPYWVMVYAIGDLTGDPDWKLSHAHEDENLQTAPQPPRRQNQPQRRQPDRRQNQRHVQQFQQVRYR